LPGAAGEKDEPARESVKTNRKKVKVLIFFIDKTTPKRYNCSMIRVKAAQEKAELPKGQCVSWVFFMVSSLRYNASKRLSLLFWLIALHSFLVGWLLILHPAGLIEMLGFNPIDNHFFPVQGGVFHILMSILYLAVARRWECYRWLINFSILVKSGALVFLLSYFFFMEPILMVLISGIVDGIMAGVIAAAYYSCRQQESASAYPG
jgi:hypothetical protein